MSSVLLDPNSVAGQKKMQQMQALAMVVQVAGQIYAANTPAPDDDMERLARTAFKAAEIFVEVMTAEIARVTSAPAGA